MFGIDRRQVGAFERIAKRASTGGMGWIDLLVPGQMAVEHKSAGGDLDAAMEQVIDYLPSLTKAEHPWLLIACDFQTFRWQNLETDEEGEFPLSDFPDHVELFWWLAGYNAPHVSYGTEEEANLAATKLLANVHDRLKAHGYPDADLREWMTRILFVLFADDTGVWDRAAFHTFLSLHTNADGSDLGQQLALLFQVLNTPHDKRPGNLDEDLKAFTYINGDLFARTLQIPVCDEDTRNALLFASVFNWGTISPAIFGSLFQNVMTKPERRQLGAHYTTEENILRVIEPLFLNDLRAELQAATTEPKLRALHDKLAGLKFIDPAAGCGNFLVIAYRELRRLETEILRRLAEKDLKRGASGRGQIKGQRVTSLDLLCRVQVDQFHAIEIDEWPARIARTAMYLADHIANREVSAEFGEHFVRFPIPKAPHIVIGNALRMDWEQVLPDPDWVFGNPPFVERKNRDADQQADHALVHGTAPGVGNLDYVTCWFVKAAAYMAATGAQTAFVATNSITQGSQVPVLWSRLFNDNVYITFGHRSFNWTSDASGTAHVHVVIIGMQIGKPTRKLWLWDYPGRKSPAAESNPSSISCYLTDNDRIIVHGSPHPIVAGIPASTYGSTAGDKGHLIFEEGNVARAKADPVAAKYLKLYIGADEFFPGKERWVLWFEKATASEMRSSALITHRVEQVRKFRAASKRAQTQKAAATPWLLLEARAPKARYLFVPCVSSERREYAPMEYRGTDTIVRASSWFIEGADDYIFGMMHSAMFMAWVRNIGGRLKSDLQISAQTTYNVFPWPSLTPAARRRVEAAAAGVRAARSKHPKASLEELYDPLFMPADLRRAHNALDAATDAAIAPRRKFTGDGDRLSVLLENYQQIAAPLLAAARTKRSRRK